jgi:hypothetical protein
MANTKEAAKKNGWASKRVCFSRINAGILALALLIVGGMTWDEVLWFKGSLPLVDPNEPRTTRILELEEKVVDLEASATAKDIGTIDAITSRDARLNDANDLIVKLKAEANNSLVGTAQALADQRREVEGRLKTEANVRIGGVEATVSLLKAENAGLKRQVRSLDARATRLAEAHTKAMDAMIAMYAARDEANAEALAKAQSEKNDALAANVRLRGKTARSVASMTLHKFDRDTYYTIKNVVLGVKDPVSGKISGELFTNEGVSFCFSVTLAEIDSLKGVITMYKGIICLTENEVVTHSGEVYTRMHYPDGSFKVIPVRVN